ncbi:MAG: cytochrome c oxidase accessory protein CcoG [Alphaproteobacteria bacterium]|nr:cytochrome c oxidase accessory protein CcoG [Alphaproteobacteria bacterium]
MEDRGAIKEADRAAPAAPRKPKATTVPAEVFGGGLYKTRDKVYCKSVSGTVRRWKWIALSILLGIYYIVPFLRWDRGPHAPDQAILMDMAGRRGYFLWIEIWPQEVYYLTGVLILSAIGLFLVTSLFGRIWCGFACPQTVWTDLFMAVERAIEGDRAQRIKLDKAPMSVSKVVRKSAKHTAWIAISLATGGAWVLYFYDAPTFFRDLAAFEVSNATLAMIALFTSTTYLLAGWAREQVCTYMCPWPRFQSAMLDEQSLVVTYQKPRGEPRGKGKGGDCVDCSLCVQVCPTGIDIRDGQQMECIGCGLCIDACNAVMKKIDKPVDLIAWSTVTAQQALEAGREKPRFRVIRPRTLIYASVLVVVSVAMATALALRPTTGLTVLRDRAPLFVTLSDGSIRNGYTVKILNKVREERPYTLTTTAPDAHLSVALGDLSVEGQSVTLSTKPDTVSTFRVYVTRARSAVPMESVPLGFIATEADTGARTRTDTVFLAPK